MEVIFISGIFYVILYRVLAADKAAEGINRQNSGGLDGSYRDSSAGYYFYQLGYWECNPHMIGVTVPFPLLYGPLLFLYTRYSLRNDHLLNRLDYLHFIPALATYIYMSGFYFFYTAEEKILVDTGQIQDYDIFKIVLMIIILISGLSYSILAYRLTLKHKQKINNYFSYREGINLQWLRICILSIGLVFLSATIVFLMQDAFGIQFSVNMDYISYLIVISFIFYIGYFGIKQENIFTNNPQMDDQDLKKPAATNKYKNSGIKSDDASSLYEKLLSIMEQEKPYLESKLSLASLAGRLEISPNQLSQIINQMAKVNFYDFINAYRVEEFIRKAGENRNYSLLALAFDSGFNSKSSFNNIFKKQKGLSPSKFLSTEVQNNKEM